MTLGLGVPCSVQLSYGRTPVGITEEGEADQRLYKSQRTVRE